MSENHFKILEAGKNVRKTLLSRSEKMPENGSKKLKNARKCFGIQIPYFSQTFW